MISRINNSSSKLFRRLRNRLILINLAATTAVLAIAFSTIYFVAQNATGRRPIIPEDAPKYTAPISEIIHERIQDERQESLESLLIVLIIVGALVEVIVAIFSYIFAEISIRPVQESYESQKIFLANASHEIKTPLAAIAANLEAADLRDNHWIDNVWREVNHLSALNQNLLTLARLDSLNTSLADKETFSTAEALGQLISSSEPRAKLKGMKIHFSVTSNLASATLARTDFLQICSILFDNAIKYGEKSIKIHLSAREVMFSNDGAPIPPAKLSHIFERFYQGDKTSEGVGLGLAIAKSLADRHQWSLQATSKPGTMTQFVLKW